MLYRNLDGDGRRGVHPFVPARRGRPIDRLRQDEPGERPWSGERFSTFRRSSSPAARCSTGAGEGVRSALQRLLPLSRGAARRAHNGAGLGRDRERHVPFERSLHDNGHHLDDGVRDGGAGAHASRRCSDPGRRLAAPTSGGSGGEQIVSSSRLTASPPTSSRGRPSRTLIWVPPRSPARPTRSCT